MTPAEQALQAEALDFHRVRRERIADETERVLDMLGRTAADFLHFPWPSLDAVIGGIAESSLWYLVVASGNGKTLMLSSFIDVVVGRQEPVYAFTTEASPERYRLAMTAQTLGYKPGDVLTDEYLKWPDAPQVVAKLRRATEQRELLHRDLLQFSPRHGYLTAAGIRQGAREAALMGAKWVVVDHVDFVDPGARGGELAESNAVNAAIQDAKVQYGQRWIVSSQMNQEVFTRHGKMTPLMVPVENWVKYGGTKKQNAEGMIGGSRVMKQGVSKEDTERFKAGLLPLAEMVEPGTMRLTIMKHRDHDQHVGRSCLLRVEQGRLVEPDPFDRQSLDHGIRTTRPRLI